MFKEQFHKQKENNNSHAMETIKRTKYKSKKRNSLDYRDKINMHIRNIAL